MKKIYTIILAAACAGVSQAQLTLTKAGYEPALGDMMMQMQYDSTTAVPKSIGAGQNWNFTSLSATTNTQLTTYTTVASTPGGSILFPSATIAAMEVGGSNTNYEYYQSLATTFEYAGSSNPSSVQTTTFSNTGTLYKWPISFSSTNTDNFVATQTSTSSTSNITGTVSYVAAGTGTVTLPGGNKHINCLQVIQTLSLTVVTGTNTATQTETQYTYFSSSVKMPILVATYDAQTSGTVTSKSYNIQVNTGALTTGINEQSLSSSKTIIYPNPAAGSFKVQLPDGGTASSIEVIDLNGRVVSRQTDTNTMNASSLPKAAYFVRIKYKDEVIQKPIMITE